MEPVLENLVALPPVDGCKLSLAACTSEAQVVGSTKSSLSPPANSERTPVYSQPSQQQGTSLKQVRLLFSETPPPSNTKKQQQRTSITMATAAQIMFSESLPGTGAMLESPLDLTAAMDSTSRREAVKGEESMEEAGKMERKEGREEEEEEEGEDREVGSLEAPLLVADEDMDTSDLTAAPRSGEEGSPVSAPGNQSDRLVAGGCGTAKAESKASKASKPKLKLTKAERDALRARRERAKEEAKAKREAEKEKREQEKREKRDKREREEQERKERREQEERERREKREKEDQDKKERRERKEAEKRKRDEERRKKEDEKKQSEQYRETAKQEKIRKNEEAKNRFLGFFSRVPKDVSAKKESLPRDSFTFLTPFPVQPSMTLATPPHFPLVEEQRATFDQALQHQNALGDYLAECKEKPRTIGAKKTRDYTSKAIVQSGEEKNGRLGEDGGEKVRDDQSVIIVQSDEEESKSAEDDVMIVESLGSAKGVRSSERPKFKLLQFHLNHRPAYWGTWQRKSSKVNPRNPFRKDKAVLDYDVDSDEEWEEEEPGESISNSEGEEQDSGDDMEDDDGFFVPHGYLSVDEGELSDGEKCGPIPLPGDMSENRKQKQLANAKAWEAEFRRKCQPLRPIKIGCIWSRGSVVDDAMDIVSHDQELLCQFSGISLVELPICIDTRSPAEKSQENQTNGESTRRPVPEEAMPDLVSLVHGSSMGIARLMKTFRVHWGARMAADTNRDKDSPSPPSSTLPLATPQRDAEYETASGISKRQLERKILAIATKEQRQGHHRPIWYVQDAVMQQYNLDPTSLTPLVPVATPFSEKSCEKVRQVSPETPCSSSGGKKKGVKRKIERMQSVKSLFEALVKSPPNSSGKPSAKKAKLELPTFGVESRVPCANAEPLEPVNKGARCAEVGAGRLPMAAPSETPDVVIILEDSSDNSDQSSTKENATPTTSPPPPQVPVLPSVCPMDHKPGVPTKQLSGPALQGGGRSLELIVPLQESTNTQTCGSGGVAAGELGVNWQAVIKKSETDVNMVVVSADVHHTT